MNQLRLRVCLTLVVMASALGFCSQAAAQNVTITTQQIEEFQALNAEQRQQLVQQQRISVPQIEQPIDQVDTVLPREVSNGNQPVEEPESESSDALLRIEPQPQSQNTSLEPFGYDLFAGTPTTFAPATNIPVPSTYIVGPGDTVIVQLYGQQNATYELVINREGELMFPEIGPVSANGLSFAELRELLQTIVSNQLIGQSVSIAMGPLRSIDVFVLGEAFRPGSYTVSSLSTMTNALFVSGGVTSVGSLRNVRLMRRGQLVTELDLYDLLLRGDTSGDARLQPGDVIFVPPIGRTVGITGEIRRPAIYEIKDETTIAEVVTLSGGLTPTAYPAASRIERINESGERTLIDLDLSDLANSPSLADGDLVQINSIMNQLEDVVLLAGHVQRPGGFQWREGLRVSDVIQDIEVMLPDPDLGYAIIVREVMPTRRIELLHVDLGSALLNPGSDADAQLQPRDQLVTFGASQVRREQLDSFLQRLDEQSSFDAPARVVTISGNVRFPGRYPLLQGMTLDLAISFAGGLTLETDLDSVLIERRVEPRGTISVQRHGLNPQTLRTNSAVALKELDQVFVFSTNQPRQTLLEGTLNRLQAQASSDQPTEIVSISGPVRYPGNYPLTRDLTVKDLIVLAGGLQERASSESVEVASPNSVSVAGREVQIREVNLSGRSERLKPGERVTVRHQVGWNDLETVTISGEVNSPGTYLITSDDTLASLIARAGGMTPDADLKAAIFLRESLRQAEREALEAARSDLQQQILAQRLQATEEDSASGGDEELNVLLDELNQATPTGRLIIDLPASLAGRAEPLELRDGDQLLIPASRVEVTVTGEVYQPSSHLFDPRLDAADYIAASGSFTPNADTGSVYVIKANGRIEAASGMRWFFQGRSPIEPGDTIVVPTEVLKSGSLQTLSSVSQVLFNLSTTLLAIQRVGN